MGDKELMLGFLSTNLNKLIDEEEVMEERVKALDLLIEFFGQISVRVKPDAN